MKIKLYKVVGTTFCQGCWFYKKDYACVDCADPWIYVTEEDYIRRMLEGGSEAKEVTYVSEETAK